MSNPHLVEDYQPGTDDDPTFFPAFFDEQQGAFPTLPGSFPTAHAPVPGSFPVWQTEETSDEWPSNPQDEEQETEHILQQQQHQQQQQIDRNVKTSSRRKKRIISGVVCLAFLVVGVVIVLLIFFVIKNDDENQGQRETLPIPTIMELYRAVDAFLSGNGIDSIEQIYGNIEAWDVSILSDFQELFSVNRNPNAQTFNADLSQWNVSLGLSFLAMFRGARAFNADISGWGMNRAITIESMFENATNFRQDLCPWLDDLAPNVGTTLAFDGTACPTAGTATNLISIPPGPLCFDCSNRVTVAPSTAITTVAKRCFESGLELTFAVDALLLEPSGKFTSDLYGHPIGSWCLSQVDDLSRIFDTDRNPATQFFNEDISGWDVSSATAMFAMFHGALRFNQGMSFGD